MARRRDAETQSQREVPAPRRPTTRDAHSQCRPTQPADVASAVAAAVSAATQEFEQQAAQQKREFERQLAARGLLAAGALEQVATLKADRDVIDTAVVALTAQLKSSKDDLARERDAHGKLRLLMSGADSSRLSVWVVEQRHMLDCDETLARHMLETDALIGFSDFRAEAERDVAAHQLAAKDVAVFVAEEQTARNWVEFEAYDAQMRLEGTATTDALRQQLAQAKETISAERREAEAFGVLARDESTGQGRLLAAAKEALDQKSALLDNAVFEVSSLRGKLRQAQEELQSESSAHRAVTAELKQTRADLAASQQLTTKLEERTEDAEGVYEAYTKLHEQRKREWQQELAEQQQEAASLQHQLDETTRRRDELKHLLDEAARRLEDQRVQLRRAEDELNTASSQLAEARRLHRDAEAALGELRADLPREREEAAAAAAARVEEAALHKVSELQQSIVQLTDLASQHQQDAEQVRAKYDTAVSRCNEYATELARARSAVTSAEDRAERAEAAMRLAQQRQVGESAIIGLQADQSQRQLQQQLEHLQKERDDFHRRSVQFEGERDVARNEVELLQGKVRVLSKRALSADQAAHEAQLAAQRHQLARQGDAQTMQRFALDVQQAQLGLLAREENIAAAQYQAVTDGAAVMSRQLELQGVAAALGGQQAVVALQAQAAQGMLAQSVSALGAATRAGSNIIIGAQQSAGALMGHLGAGAAFFVGAGAELRRSIVAQEHAAMGALQNNYEHIVFQVGDVCAVARGSLAAFEATLQELRQAVRDQQGQESRRLLRAAVRALDASGRAAQSEELSDAPDRAELRAMICDGVCELQQAQQAVARLSASQAASDAAPDATSDDIGDGSSASPGLAVEKIDLDDPEFAGGAAAPPGDGSDACDDDDDAAAPARSATRAPSSRMCTSRSARGVDSSCRDASPAPVDPALVDHLRGAFSDEGAASASPAPSAPGDGLLAPQSSLAAAAAPVSGTPMRGLLESVAGGSGGTSLLGGLSPVGVSPSRALSASVAALPPPLGGSSSAARGSVAPSLGRSSGQPASLSPSGSRPHSSSSAQVCARGASTSLAGVIQSSAMTPAPSFRPSGLPPALGASPLLARMPSLSMSLASHATTPSPPRAHAEFGKPTAATAGIVQAGAAASQQRSSSEMYAAPVAYDASPALFLRA